MDTIILVEDGVVRCASVTKQKDAKAGPPLSFELVDVTLGSDEEGEPVTAGVVRYRPAQTDRKLPAGPAAVLEALRAAIAAADGSPVSEETWRAAWAAHPEIAGKSDDTQRKAWARCRDLLRSNGRVLVHAGEWSIPATNEAVQPMDFSPE